MGYSHQTILRALREPENNQIKVAYQLVVDHKRMLNNSCVFYLFISIHTSCLDSHVFVLNCCSKVIHRLSRPAKSSSQKSIQSFFATSPPPWNLTFNEGSDDTSSISVLNSSLPNQDIDIIKGSTVANVPFCVLSSLS